MFTRRVGDDCSLYRLAIEGDIFHALLLTIGMDGDLIVGLAELTIHSVIGGSLGQTGINADTIIVGFDTEDEL